MKSQVAVVIGATGTLGRSLVGQLAAADIGVVAIARSKDRLNELVHQTASRHGVQAVVMDATNEHEITRLATIHNEYRRIDYVIYSAAIEPDPDIPLTNYTTAAWDATFDTYLKGFFLCFREIVKYSPPVRHIVAISSAVTRFASHRLPIGIHAGHYAAAKAALDELCKWARRDAHERQILLSRIAPGAIDCLFHRTAPPHRRPHALVDPADVAQRIIDSLLNSREIDELIVADSS